MNAEDQLAIMELVANYNYRIDHFESEAWADLFTEDGVFKADGAIRARGRQQLVQYLEKRRIAGGPRLRHWTTNTLIEGDGPSARLRAYVMAFNITEGLEAPYIMGEYDDQLVRHDGHWKFRTRQVTICAGRSVASR